MASRLLSDAIDELLQDALNDAAKASESVVRDLNNKLVKKLSDGKLDGLDDGFKKHIKTYNSTTGTGGMFVFDKKWGIVIRATGDATQGAEDVPLQAFRDGMGATGGNPTEVIKTKLKTEVLNGDEKPIIKKVGGKDRFVYDNTAFDDAKTGKDIDGHGVQYNDPGEIVDKLAGDDRNAERLMISASADALKNENLEAWNRLVTKESITDKGKVPVCFGTTGSNICLGGPFGDYVMKYITKLAGEDLEDIFADAKNWTTESGVWKWGRVMSKRGAGKVLDAIDGKFGKLDSEVRDALNDWLLADKSLSDEALNKIKNTFFRKASLFSEWSPNCTKYGKICMFGWFMSLIGTPLAGFITFEQFISQNKKCNEWMLVD